MTSAACVVVIATLALQAAGAPGARVTAERATVRATPATSSATVAIVAANTELEVTGEEGAWLRVRIKSTGEEGYIPAAFVQRNEAAGSPSSAPAAAPGPASAANVPPPPAVPRRPRTFLMRGFGGFWSAGGSTGFQAGGGVALAPFRNNEAFEISTDASVMRVSGTNAFSGGGSVTYNFVIPSQKITPFAGAGLTAIHTPSQIVTLDLGVPFDFRVGGGTDVALQLLGGIDRPLNDRRAFRGEARVQFLPGDTSLALLAGISF